MAAGDQEGDPRGREAAEQGREGTGGPGEVAKRAGGGRAAAQLSRRGRGPNLPGLLLRFRLAVPGPLRPTPRFLATEASAPGPGDSHSPFTRPSEERPWEAQGPGQLRTSQAGGFFLV